MDIPTRTPAALRSGDTGSSRPGTAVPTVNGSFRCLVCAHGVGRFVLQKQGLVLARCHACGFVQQDPLPAADEYDARYQDVEGYCDALVRDVQLFLRRDEVELAALARLGATGPLLDVGAGAGILLQAAQRRGWEAVGLELASPSVQRIRDELGLTVIQEPIEQAPLAPGSFGVVTFSHSLEHLREPVSALRCAARLLRPGGLVHIAVPNWQAAKRWVAGTHIPWIFSEHLSYFTRRTLVAALRRASFDVLDCRVVPMVCDVDYRFAVAVVERVGFDRAVRAFLRMGPRRLGELLTDNVQLTCPSWRFRLVVQLARASLKAWPEGFFSHLGWGEELRVTARRREPGPPDAIRV